MFLFKACIVFDLTKNVFVNFKANTFTIKLPTKAKNVVKLRFSNGMR